MEMPMRALGCIIALILLLAGPSLAGSADGNLPGVGSFTYNGSPIPGPAPTVMAAWALSDSNLSNEPPCCLGTVLSMD
jgi:hypothetical protein